MPDEEGSIEGLTFWEHFGVLRRYILIVGAFFFAGRMGACSLALSYTYLVPISFDAFSHYIVPGTSLTLTADGYVSFVFLVTTVCFVVVELPVVIVALAYVRLVNPFWLATHRRYLYISVLIL